MTEEMADRIYDTAKPEMRKSETPCQFQVGDVVRLKSGGPKMTVSAVPDGDHAPAIACTWFDESGPRVFAVEAATLEKAPELVKSPPKKVAGEKFVGKINKRKYESPPKKW